MRVVTWVKSIFAALLEFPIQTELIDNVPIHNGTVIPSKNLDVEVQNEDCPPKFIVIYFSLIFHNMKTQIHKSKLECFLQIQFCHGLRVYSVHLCSGLGLPSQLLVEA